MPITKKKISYELDLSRQLEGLSNTQRTEAKRAIAEFIVSEIENQTQAQVSPVTGQGFTPLSKVYKDRKKALGKGGDADLHLNNDMIDSIKAQVKESSVVFKITNPTEKKKAFNHNVGDTLPRRTFLPDDTKKGKFGTFNEGIRKGVRDIVKGVKSGS